MGDRYPLPVYYDFASTICYVAHRVLGRLATRIDEIGVELEWRPVDLTRLTGWKRGARVSGPGRENALRVAEELGVPVRMPAYWIDSRPALATALDLRGDPVKEAVWRERIWTAVYEEGREIDDVAPYAADVGVAVSEAGGESPVVDATEQARREGVQGVPTFLIDTWPMAGIQDDQSMTAFFERYARKRRRERGESD